VTLRAVAHRVGVTPAQVRRAFGSRDRLVAALVQHLFSRPSTARPGTARHGVGEPSPETPEQALARLATEEWVAYREHPWLVTVLASSRPPLVPAVLDAARASTAAFVALGLDPPSALGRYVALSGYVQGMALLLLAERGEAMRSGSAYRTWWSEELRRLDRTGTRRRHPWLDAASGGRLPESFAADADTWFRDGLDRVLAGLTTDKNDGTQK
jgi:AcrR family transcriptional regulator